MSPEAEAAAREAAREGFRVLYWGGSEKTVTGIFTDEAIDALEKRRGIRYVEVDAEIEVTERPLSWEFRRLAAGGPTSRRKDRPRKRG